MAVSRERPQTSVTRTRDIRPIPPGSVGEGSGAQQEALPVSPKEFFQRRLEQYSSEAINGLPLTKRSEAIEERNKWLKTLESLG